MTYSIKAVRILSIVALATLVSSCWEDFQNCNEELKVGDVLRLELGEQYSSVPGATWTPETCQEAFGLEPGEVFDIIIEGFIGYRTCASAYGEIAGLSTLDLTMHPDGEDQRGGESVSSPYTYEIEDSDCSGVLDFTVEIDVLPATDWDGEGRPQANAFFRFRPEGTESECPGRCYAPFATSVASEIISPNCS